MTNNELAQKLSRDVNGQVQGTDDEGYFVEYLGSDGQIKIMSLDAQDYPNALFEAVGLLCE